MRTELSSHRKARHRNAVLVAALVMTLVAQDASAATANGQSNEVIVTAQVRPNLFGTVAIPGPAGRWGDKWQRIATDTSMSPALQALVAPARMLGRFAQLGYLQSAVDRQIRWRSDGTQYGARIYWASAAETLATGFGDDDDRAILKFQALRALGYPPNDYYLVMGRDRIRGDYMMLAARTGGRWWLLEEQGDRPGAAEARLGFEPVASFGAARSWIHGRVRQSIALRSNSGGPSASAGR